MKRNTTVGAGFLVLAVMALSFMIRFVPTQSVAKDINPYLTAALLQLIVFMIPSLIYTMLRFSSRTPSLRLRLPKVRHLFFIIASIAVIVLGSTLINFGMFAIIGDSYQSSSASAQALGTGENAIGGLYAVIAFAIVPAVCEEYLFRGVVCAEFECVGVGAAVFFSTVLFSMAHFSLMRLPVYLFSGAVLAFVMYVTRSVIASMIVHTATNSVALFFESFVYKVVNRQGVVIFIFIAAALFFIFAAAALGEAEKIYRRYALEGEKPDYRLPKKERVGLIEAILCPPVLFTAVFFIVTSFAF